jgi:hypothetical protein
MSLRVTVLSSKTISHCALLSDSTLRTETSKCSQISGLNHLLCDVFMNLMPEGAGLWLNRLSPCHLTFYEMSYSTLY